MKKWLLLIIVVACVIGLDQLAKAWTLARLDFGQSLLLIPAIGDFFRVTLSANRGAAFSILPQLGDLFLLAAVVLSVGAVVIYARIPLKYWPERIALGMVVGGGISNALDRARFGYVVDFFHVIIPPLNVSNISNFADHAITLGVLILIIMAWFVRHTDAEATPSVPAE